MDVANYVNKVGKIANDATKYNIKIDRNTLINIILFNHLHELVGLANDLLNVTEYSEPITQEDINKLNEYANCLKKEIDIYPVDAVDNCVLTEVKEYIVQE